jgi:uncharacterized protein YbaP (TraB family)
MKPSLTTRARRAALALSASLMAFAPMAANAQTPGAAPLAAVQSEGAGPRLWVVRDADSTIYLFGTIHLLRPDTAWGSERVTRAYAEADEVWFEVADVDDPTAAPMLMERGVSPDRPLSTRLTPGQWAQLDRAARSLGATADALDPLKPWFAGMQLGIAALLKAGYDPASGVELTLHKRAEADGKTIRGFETYAGQVDIFDGLPEEAQIAFITTSLDDFENAGVEFDALVAGWADGDTTVMERLLVDEMKGASQAFYDALLTRRNAAWAEEIDALLDGSGVAFIAVGSGHLVGPDSVQAQLAARGIRAEEAPR